MFDCLDTAIATPRCADAGQPLCAASPAAVLPDALSLTRRYPGRSWLRVTARAGRASELARLREVALHFGAEVEKLGEGTLLVLGLSLNQTLALNECFGHELALAAHAALPLRAG